jgi:2-polyprenyl-3-methyl-5-hydroxy-6-metoxy-1,4-benzoquinol methylase
LNKDTTNWDPTAHYKDESVAHKYDEVRFSSLAGRVFNKSEKRIIADCFRNLPRDTIVLDMPCGTGRLAETLLEAGLQVHGADISEEMLQVATTRLAKFGEHFKTEVIDAFQQTGVMPRFEASLCARVLMHFPLDKQIQFLKGVVSLTRGTVVINHSFSSPYQRFRRFIKRMLGHQAPANYPVTESDINRLLLESGLIEVRRFRINSLISEAIYIVADKKSEACNS